MLMRSASAAVVMGGRQRSTLRSCSTIVNDPKVLAEVQREFARYERALCGNDVQELDALFLDSSETVRYGTAENLYGYDAIKAFRNSRASPGDRKILRSVVTSYGKDYAVTNLEFQRHGSN